MLLLALACTLPAPIDSGKGAESDADTDADTDADSDADSDSDSDSDSDADSDADTDADTDSDTDSDTDADTDADVDAACGRYHAATLVGAEGVSRFTALAESTLGYGGTNSNVTDAYDPRTGIGTISSVTDVSGRSFTRYRSWSTSDFRCDDEGLWYVGYTLDWDYVTADGFADTGSLVYTYDDGYLVVPAAPDVGSRWRASGTATYSGDSSGVYAYDIDFEVLEEASVTVDAGTYTALRVRQDSDGSISDYWIAPDVGTVKSDYLELESWAP